jgi:hypothetical protein
MGHVLGAQEAGRVIEGLTLGFAVGLFAVLSPGALAFAVALAGLPVRRPLRAAAAMGACFGVVFALAAVAVSVLDLEWLLDVAAWVAAASGAVLAAVGVRIVVGGPRDEEVPVVGFGSVAAIAALPPMLVIYESLLHQGAESAGAPAAVFLTVAFGAGCASALALPALAAAALAGASRVARRAAGALVLVAGIWIVVYWLPALFGGHSDRGELVEGTANGLSSALSGFAASYELGFALVLLAAAVSALAGTMRPRTR